MEEKMDQLVRLAWAVRRMRDAQREFEKTGDVMWGRMMRAAEARVDELVLDATGLPDVIPFGEEPK